VQGDAAVDGRGERDADREVLMGAGGEPGRVRAGHRLRHRRTARIGAGAGEAEAGVERVADLEATRVVRGAVVCDRERVVEPGRVARGRRARAELAHRQIGLGLDRRMGLRVVVGRVRVGVLEVAVAVLSSG